MLMLKIVKRQLFLGHPISLSFLHNIIHIHCIGAILNSKPVTAWVVVPAEPKGGFVPQKEAVLRPAIALGGLTIVPVGVIGRLVRMIGPSPCPNTFVDKIVTASPVIPVSGW